MRERRIDLDDDTLRYLFDMADQDKSGTLERDELRNLTKLLPGAKQMVAAEEAEEVFERSEKSTAIKSPSRSPSRSP